MKKVLTIIIISLVTTYSAFSQSTLRLFDDTNAPISNGTTLWVYGDTASATILSKAVWVKNTNTSMLNVKVRKTCLSSPTGTKNTFCWTICYNYVACIQAPFETDTIHIRKDSLCKNFVGECKPLGKTGVTSVKYTFYDADNTQDSIYVIINYSAGSAGITQNELENIVFSNAYPNPASSYISLKVSVPATSKRNIIVIKDMLGSIVKEIKLDGVDDIVRINVNDLADGIYFYSLLIDDKIFKTKKLIINK
jgi:hypothetical protein